MGTSREKLRKAQEARAKERGVDIKNLSTLVKNGRQKKIEVDTEKRYLNKLEDYNDFAQKTGATLITPTTTKNTAPSIAQFAKFFV